MISPFGHNGAQKLRQSGSMSLETINPPMPASRRVIANGRIAGLTPASLVLAAMFILLIPLATASDGLADFRAGWMAGRAFAAGDFHLIYPQVQGLYTMRPPAEWVASLRAQGYGGVIYPFVYPPLWAWFAAQVTKVWSFGTISALAGLLNPAMVVAMLLMAQRFVAPNARQASYLLAGLIFLTATTIGFVGFRECQPQIFVAFLTLLAIERSESGHSGAAGCALALAASMKLFPALIALLFLARGQHRSAAVFAVAGAGLAAFSVAVAGWPLHREFLGVIGDVSATTFVTGATYSLESTVAQVFFRDALQMLPLTVTSPDLAENFRITALAEPKAFSLFFGLLQLAALALLALLFRRMSRDRTQGFPLLLWPFALTVMTLTGPLAWPYYYFAPMAFAPVVLNRMGTMPGLIALGGCGAILSPFTQGRFFAEGTAEGSKLFILQGTGTAVMVMFALLFFCLALRDRGRAGCSALLAP